MRGLVCFGLFCFEGGNCCFDLFGFFFLWGLKLPQQACEISVPEQHVYKPFPFGIVYWYLLGV